MHTSPEYFDAAYAYDAEVFGPAAGWYEARKRAVLLASLGRERYDCAFEPGCGNGALSRALALRCSQLLCMDVSPRALVHARNRVRGVGNVTFSNAEFPQGWPSGLSFDLIVVSELLYYLDDEEITLMAGLATGALRPGSELVCLHWRHASPDYPNTGERAHRILRLNSPRLQVVLEHDEKDFVLLTLAAGDAP
jgi:SAM-dependent methyltransferase